MGNCARKKICDDGGECECGKSYHQMVRESQVETEEAGRGRASDMATERQ